MSDCPAWIFPLPRPHTGLLAGNGILGAMVWGAGNQLNITLNHAGFWDHRGARRWTAKMNYPAIRAALQDGDAKAIGEIFAQSAAPGALGRTTRLPFGRFELMLSEDATLESGDIDFATGRMSVNVHRAGRVETIAIEGSMAEPVLHVQLSDPSLLVVIRRHTAWEDLRPQLEKGGYTAPTPIDGPNTFGWIMVPPADDSLAAICQRDGGSLWIALDLAATADAARAGAERTLARHRSAGAERFLTDAAAWWAGYRADLPKVELPDPNVQFLLDYGLYKFAGLSNPAGIAAGLQGPWVEEYQMPPWSADYHFNINVQMCYQPAYQANRTAHLRPLFDLVWSWRDQLRENAHHFVGIDDGFMLPHAVDDRCGIVDAFWTGTIDHACTAWVAKMMFDAWLYGGDEGFLRDRAYPFMVGAMRVYEEMLERDGDGFTLPVGVSPEYRDDRMNAWGIDASFQLAAIHWLVEALQRAAKVLGETPRAIWGEIQRGLPRATVEKIRGRDTIMMWKGTELEESHRHHSFIAAIAPFDVISIDDPAWHDIIRASIDQWIHRGMGLWSGWCMSWAATLHAHVGHRDMPSVVLEMWRRVFVNAGHGTLHDHEFPGLTLLGPDADADPAKKKEIMQMDAGMGAAAAILDMLAHCRRGVAHIMPGVPAAWREVRFARVGIEGGFLVSAEKSTGQLRRVMIHAPRAGELALCNPFPRPGGEVVLHRAMNAGDTLVLEAAP